MAKNKMSFHEIDRLVKMKNNEKLKKLIVEKVDTTELTDNCGTTLLHLAAKYNNVDLLKFLLSSGFDFNAKNVCGTTPVLMAASCNNSEALNVLLEANANIFAPALKGKSILQIIIDKKRGIPTTIIADVLKHLRKKSDDAKKTVRELNKINCPLDLVLLMEDAEVTAMMLSQKKTMGPKECYRLMERAMKSGYLNNVKVLLKHGNGNYTSMMAYVNNICKMVDDLQPNLESAKLFVEKMTKWNLYGQFWLIVALSRVFKDKSRHIVQFFLDCGVHERVTEKFGFDLIVDVFQNDNFEANELLEDRTFDANALNMQGLTGLHLAASKGLEGNIEFLLEKGADPNVTDKEGLSALHYTDLPDCVILLLKYGADLQIVGTEGETIFDGFDDSTMVLLAHLALVQVQGVEVKKEILEKINADSEMKHLFEKCAWQLEKMKSATIYMDVTLYTVLFEKIEKFYSCIRNPTSVNIILSHCKECGIHDYYSMMLQEKLIDAARMFDLRWKAAFVVAECTKIFYPGHMVVNMILNYLSLEDLKVLNVDEY